MWALAHMFCFLIWPISLIRDGIDKMKERPAGSILAISVATLGFFGYLTLPYWLFTLYVKSSLLLPPTPGEWLFVSIAYIIGYGLSWKIFRRILNKNSDHNMEAS
jgi:hypothetical protein